MFSCEKVEHISHTDSHSPLPHDDDDGSQQENEDHKAASAGPEDQTHVLCMLGDLQSPLGVLTGSCRPREERLFTSPNKNNSLSHSFQHN